MKLLKKVFDFYIFSNIHVALASASLVAISYFNEGISPKISYITFTFFTTFLAYQLIRWFDLFFSKSMQINELLRKISLLEWILSGVSIGASFYTLRFFEFKNVLVLVPVIILTFWYAFPFNPFRGKPMTLRQFPQMKIVIIALVWTLMSVAFPLQNDFREGYFWVELIQRFFFIVAITIPFDIRDFESDPAELTTLPQRIGVEQAKKIGILLMLGYFMLIFFKYPLTFPQVFSEVMIVGISILFIAFSKVKRSVYYTAFWVESIPVMWAILLFLALKIHG